MSVDFELVDATVIRPGDTLIVRVRPDISQQMAVDVKERLMRALPGLADVVVIAAEQLAVMRPERVS